MPIRHFRDRRPRLLSPSRILRPPLRQSGGGREREELVEEAGAAMARNSRTFALATRLLDRATRERISLLYLWCRHCDDLADEECVRAGAGLWLEAIRVVARGGGGGGIRNRGDGCAEDGESFDAALRTPSVHPEPVEGPFGKLRASGARGRR